MQLRFSKMHGIGNDFVIIDLVTQRARLEPALVRKLADRHRGIGFDQLLIVEAPENDDADFRYRIFNADGSESGQCGNGARCFASFVRARKLTGKRRIRVETRDGRMSLNVLDNGLIQVDMGAPVLEPAAIPFLANAAAPCYELETSQGRQRIGAVSMGNPHAVLIVDDVDLAPVATLGAEIERHGQFPERVNVGFMQILNRSLVRLRVFERGAGETLACGSGACAAMVAGHLQGLLDDTVTVRLPGGELQIEWPGAGESVLMTGPATHVFEGRISL